MDNLTTACRSGTTDYGPHAIRRLPTRIVRYGWRRILLLTGKDSFQNSGSASIMPELRSQVALEHWTDFATNTDCRDVEVGLRRVNDFRPDAIVAVGGGSVMDMAKALCAFETVTGTDALHAAIRRSAPPAPRRLGLHLAPTTSGSGSEATHFAVVYIGEEKYSIAAQSLRPDGITLDPLLAVSGSRYQRATSGIDAVCQAIESLWASNGTTSSRRLARHALALLLSNVEAFVNNPCERSARAMCIGSHLAGRAIDVSKTTAAHALSYAITKRFGHSHGHAVALTLGKFIERHTAAGAADLQSNVDIGIHSRTMNFIGGCLGAKTGAEARQSFEQLLRRIGLHATLAEAGIVDAEDKAALISSVNVERLQNNPVKFSAEDLRHIMKQ